MVRILQEMARGAYCQRIAVPRSENGTGTRHIVVEQGRTRSVDPRSVAALCARGHLHAVRGDGTIIHYLLTRAGREAARQL